MSESKTEELLELDGSTLEGGGQVLRQSVALSSILGTEVKISKIRGGRAKPGLKRQHLAGIKLVSQIVNGRLSGAGLNAETITFTPGGSSYKTSFSADTQTAGSTALMLQISLPCLLFQQNPTTTELRGGTNAAHAPQFEYLEQIFSPFVKKHFGIAVELTSPKRGWFPRGGGIVKVNIEPVKQLNVIDLTERGEILAINGVISASGKHLRNDSDLAQIEKIATRQLKKQFRGIPVNFEIEKFNHRHGNGDGTVCMLTAETSNGFLISGCGLGEKRLHASRVANQAVDDLADSLINGGVVDVWLADQIIIFMALAHGTSKVKIGNKMSLHTETAIHFAEVVTSHWARVTNQNGGKGTKFTFDEESGILTCNGINFVNKHDDD